MDEVYAAAYHHDARTGWQLRQAPRLWTLAALRDTWAADPPARVAGNALAAFADRLPAPGARDWPDCHDRAAALLQLAAQAWHRGEGLPADQALPLYLRDKVAQTTAERQALRAAAAVAASPLADPAISPLAAPTISLLAAPPA
jgi:tRNA threonylcarbamoyladenosine biosynthesis protein TsaB